jgi:SAM-dependent methyltransferase
VPGDLPPLSFHSWLRWDVVDRLLQPLEIRTVLEVGAGQGGFGTRLAGRYSYLGLEPDVTSAAVAAGRVADSGGRVLNETTAALPPDSTFDLVCAFEVLEHIEDDQAALADWAGRVRPGGWLLLSVPAHQARMGPMDMIVGHYRRYERQQLVERFAEVGIPEVRVYAYGFPLGYLLETGRNLLAGRITRLEAIEERSGASGRLLQPSRRLGTLTRFATLPFRLLQRPFAATDLGTGFVALGRRPAD